MSIHQFDEMLSNTIQQIIEEKKKNEEELDEDKFKSAIKELYSKETIHENAGLLYKSLKEMGPSMVEEERLMKQEFESRLQLRWLNAFYDLSSVIKISEETATDIIDDYIENWDEKTDDQYFVPITFDILAKLYSKAVVLSKEIITLLKSGFADGAMSRWRSLHECNVYFKILTLNYEDKDFTRDIIHKFADYSIVESFQELNNYRKRDSKFELDKIESESIKENYNKVLEKYGKDFRKPYSWSKSLFPERRKIYFSDLEKKAGIDYLSIYYKQANYQIHASPTGLYNSLGNIQHESIEKVDYILGPSNYGLSTPGQLTLISMAQISISFLLFDSTNLNIDRAIRADVFQRFVDDATVKFDKIQQEIEEESLSKVTNTF